MKSKKTWVVTGQLAAGAMHRAGRRALHSYCKEPAERKPDEVQVGRFRFRIEEYDRFIIAREL